MVEEEKLTTKELEKLEKDFPKGGAPKAVRKQLSEFKKEKVKSKAGRKRKELMKTRTGAIKKVSKTELFTEEFLRNGGNATQAALVVFNCKNVASAASIGGQYLKKAKQLGRIYLETQGYGYGKMLSVAADKMEESKNPEWWDRLMKISGYEDFISPIQKAKAGGPIAVNVFNAHKAMASEYVIDGEVETIQDLEPTEEENEN